VTTSSKKAKPAPLWRSEFETAYDEYRLQDASEIYDRFAGGSEPPELVMKAARAHLGDPSVTLRLLLPLNIPDGRPRDQLEREAILGEAYGRTNDFRSADEHLSAALRMASVIEDDDLVAYVGYRLVKRYLFEDKPERARASLELTRRGRSRLSRVFTLFSDTLIMPYEERIDDQVEALIKLLRLLDPNDRGYREFLPIRASATHELAVVAQERYIPDAVAEIERQLSGVAWPRDLAPSLLHTHKSLAWTKALQGDYFNAFRHMKRASEAAHTTAWKVVAACERSFLARYFGERGWSRVELDEAEYSASEVDWRGTLDTERIGLLMLAELFSEIDTARSSMYLAQYRSLGEMRSLNYRSDPRLRAMEQQSTGVVELALGNRTRGLSNLREARAVYERYRYDFRAAMCLASEYRVTDNRDLVPAIEEKLRHYQQSWLAGELRGTLERPTVPLSPMQQVVFEELCSGKSTAEIARSLGRSEYTVSNHTKEIFKTFGVKSRAALLAKAARQGLVGDS
jgi:DNA-binding CsgD family transcriptional regulator